MTNIINRHSVYQTESNRTFKKKNYLKPHEQRSLNIPYSQQFDLQEINESYSIVANVSNKSQLNMET